MNVTCPSCGSPNEVEALGKEVVCASCFHTWASSEADLPGASDEPMVSFDLGLDDDDGGADLAELFGDDPLDDLVVLDGDELELVEEPDDEATIALSAMDGDDEDFEIAFGEADEATGDLGGALPFAMTASGSPDTLDEADKVAEEAAIAPPAPSAIAPPAPSAPAAAPPVPEDPTHGDTEAVPGGPAAYLFTRRRKRKALSEADMEVIGTYQRRSNDMAHAEDVVWTADSGPPRRASEMTGRKAAQKPGIDPFGETEVVTAGGAGTSTQAWVPDGGAGQGAGQGAAFDDPFGAPPAGGGGETAVFGQDTAAMDADDPFADIATGSSGGGDPFGGDPFGSGSGGADLFGSDGGDDDPFSAAAFSTGGSDTADGLQELDFSELGADAPEVGPPTAGRGAQEEPTSFFVDPSGTSGQGAGGEPGDEALFELDVPGGARTGARKGPGPKTKAAQARGRKRRKMKVPTAGGGRAKKAALLGVLGVVGVGVGLGQTDLGYFGMNAILGDDAQEVARVAPVAPVAVPADDAGRGMQSDAPQDYTARVTELQTEFRTRPDDSKVREELVRTLMRLQERYPEVYKAQAGYSELLQKLLTPAQLSSDKRLLITKLLAEGKTEDANKALDAYVTQMTNNPDDLYLMARVARSQGSTDKAVGYYLSAIEKDARFEPALFDLGEIYLERQEIGEAKGHFGALLTTNPDHSGAKLAMAQITLYEKGYAEAKTLIGEALALAKASNNPNEQFRAFWLMAKLAEAQGNPEDKEDALESALEIRPKDEDTALALAQLLNKQGKHQEALRRLKACQKAGCASAGFYRSLVEAYELSGQEDDADSQLTEALSKHPKDTGLQMLQAAKEEESEHYKTAKAIYAGILETDPSYLDAYLALSRLQLREGRQSDAVETLRSGVDHAADKMPLLEKLAEVQMKIGATLKAKETMAEILQMDPHNLEVKLRFATLLRELGYHDEAVRYYSDLNVAGALKGDLLLDYAEELFETRRFEESLNHVEAVLATDPLSLRGNVQRGALLSAKGDYDGAEEALQKALKVNSESGPAYFWLGQNELARERPKRAVEYLSKAADLDAFDVHVRFALGRALTDIGGVDNRRLALAQYSFIIGEYEKFASSAKKNQVNPEVYLQRGRLYFDNGQFKEALSDFKAAMLLDPVRQDLVIEFAKTLQTMGKRTEAETYLKEVVIRDPKNPAAHFHLGVIALKSGRRNEAEDHFKMAIATGGADFPVAHRYLGFIYKEKGLTALSCSAFREYLRVAPKTAYDREEVARLVARLCR